jgi:hypothetical protein
MMMDVNQAAKAMKEAEIEDFRRRFISTFIWREPPQALLS